MNKACAFGMLAIEGDTGLRSYNEAAGIVVASEKCCFTRAIQSKIMHSYLDVTLLFS